MKLGETILKHRTARGLSQEKLAELVGVSRQAVSKWEVGDAIPDTDKLIPLARALGITVDELLGNVPEEKSEAEDENTEPPVPPAGPEKKPGWFATHWYWLGLIPAAWGAWQLLQLIMTLVSLLLFTSNIGVGGSFEITTGAGAEEIVIGDGRQGFDQFIDID